MRSRNGCSKNKKMSTELHESLRSRASAAPREKLLHHAPALAAWNARAVLITTATTAAAAEATRVFVFQIHAELNPDDHASGARNPSAAK